jgi:gamma-glutamyltranspeptidase/glutathione hydrolase
VAGNSGILLNNQMDDFSAKPGVPNVYGLVGGDANAVEPKNARCRRCRQRLW